MINDKDKFMAALWNFDPYNEVLPGRIAFSDIDGVTEINGYFLKLELKGPGVMLTRGQRILLERYVREPNKSALVLWGDPGAPTRLWIVGAQGPIDCSQGGVVRIIRDWGQGAALARFPPEFWRAAKKVLGERGVRLPHPSVAAMAETEAPKIDWGHEYATRGLACGPALEAEFAADLKREWEAEQRAGRGGGGNVTN